MNLSFWIILIVAALGCSQFQGTTAKKWDTVEFLWPEAVVPYKISRSVGALDKDGNLLGAMLDIERSTCIKFVNWTDQKAFLDITAGFDCTTPLGYQQGKPQVLSLIIPFCLDKKRLLKNLMHVLGLPYEHIRPDRDDFIRINFDNIASADKIFFEKLNATVINLPFDELPYDYNSILHVDDTYKAINKTIPTIVPVKEGVTVGKAEGLSALDVQKLNTLYC